MKVCDLSIVIPNYNHGSYLEKCVLSVTSQSVLPREIIIVDDCSTDNSVEIIKKLERDIPIITFLVNDRNRGAVFAMNRGGVVSEGRYLYFLAADDSILPGMINRFNESINEHPQMCLFKNSVKGYVYDEYGVIREKNFLYNKGWEKEGYFSPCDAAEIFIRGGDYFSSPIYLKQAWIEAGRLIDDLGPLADWFCNAVIMGRYGVFHCSDELLERHYFCNSYGTSLSHAQHLINLRKMVELLYSPQYCDVVTFFDKSGILYFNFSDTMDHFVSSEVSDMMNFALIKRMEYQLQELELKWQ